MTRRICVLTFQHLSTCPRMLKAADALASAGYRVRVVSARHTGWAAAFDAQLPRRWSWTTVSGSLGGRLVHQAARRMAGLLRPPGPMPVVARALGRFYDGLLRAALAEPADLFYAGTRPGAALAAEASRRTGVPFAADLEDLYYEEEGGSLDDALSLQVTRRLLPHAAFLTAGSRAIGEAYSREHGLRVHTVANTFPLPPAPEVREATGPLRLYWFSQTIGPGRGLEDVVRAVGGRDWELHLRGRPQPAYLASLRPTRLSIQVHPPAPPDRMVELCRPYDVGLSLERMRPRNRALCLTNKALTYPLAGLPQAISDTPGQSELARDLGEGALVVAPGDTQALAEGLGAWADDRRRLARARAAAWEAARRRWSWEHDRAVLLDAVAQVWA